MNPHEQETHVMKANRHAVNHALRVAALVGACTALPVGAAGPIPGVNVTVTNSPSDPVPVTGAVTGTVSLSAGTGVIVDNPVTDPVRVRSVNDALQPVAVKTSCTTTAIGCGPGVFYQVPAGKRLVIEYASFQACVLPGQATGMRITTEVGGELATHDIDSAPASAGPGSPAWACNTGASSFAARGQQVRLYADPGTFVGVEGSRDSNIGNVSFRMAISGYLVDVPLTP
jgi:hypothetical protein